MHSVYKEIVAISQVLHENVVRYYACWIESVSPKDKSIKNVVRKLEIDIKKKFKMTSLTTKNKVRDNLKELTIS